jgi:hypothetical protein
MKDPTLSLGIFFEWRGTAPLGTLVGIILIGFWTAFMVLYSGLVSGALLSLLLLLLLHIIVVLLDL